MLWTHFCFRGLWEDEMFARQGGSREARDALPLEQLTGNTREKRAQAPVKRHRGEPGRTHGTHTWDPRGGTKMRGTHGTHPRGRTDHTDEPHNHPNPTSNDTYPHDPQSTTRMTTRRPKPRPTQQPQARSQPLPAADSPV